MSTCPNSYGPWYTFNDFLFAYEIPYIYMHTHIHTQSLTYMIICRKVNVSYRNGIIFFHQPSESTQSFMSTKHPYYPAGHLPWPTEKSKKQNIMRNFVATNIVFTSRPFDTSACTGGVESREIMFTTVSERKRGQGKSAISTYVQMKLCMYH